MIYAVAFLTLGFALVTTAVELRRSHVLDQVPPHWPDTLKIRVPPAGKGDRAVSSRARRRH